nr:hypothetical protein [Tanacetum cinerariifolium]
MPNGTNSSFITLIPKVANPIHVKKFRPVSLIGMQYKIIAKVLANRLSKVIDKVVSKEQSAFISGRFILDGPLMLSEIMSWYKKKKINLMLFKVDFEKAFDIVSWKFLDHMLSSLGFGNKWHSCINICLHSVRASVLVNGSPTSEFSIKRDWNRQDMINIIHALHVFYLASGLKINVSKSNIYILGMNPQDIEDMARDTRCGSGSLGIYYLSIFKCPESVLNSLEATRASFFWGGSNEKKNAWVKWENVMASFEKGGLIIGSIKAFNLTLLQKAEAGIDLKGCYCNGVWASIISTYSMLHNRNLIMMNTLCRKVGNGLSIRFWKDTWNGGGTLMSRQIEGSRNEAALGSLVSDLVQVQLLDGPDSWSWNLDDDGIFSVHVTRLHIDSFDHVFFGCDVWRLVRRWTNLDMPSFSSWFDCFQWFEDLRASRDVKDKAYVIFVTFYGAYGAIAMVLLFPPTR